MDDDKIINFPITSAEQYKAYLKAEETTMMKIAGKLGCIYGTLYTFLNQRFKNAANRPLKVDFVEGPICLSYHVLTKSAASADFCNFI